MLWRYGRCLPLFFLLVASSCAKEKLTIGREDPEAELQKCVKLSQKKRYSEAVECLEIFKSRFPQTREGQEAGLRIADTYFVQKQYLLAAQTYETFVQLNPLHPKADYALYRAGLAYFQEAPKSIDRDQQYLFKAKESLEGALRAAYQSPYEDLIRQSLGQINERLAERLFYIGRFYYRTKEYLSAIPRFEELITQYPHSQRVPRTLYYIVRSRLELTQEEPARTALAQLVQNFPRNDWTKKAQRHYIETTDHGPRTTD